MLFELENLSNPLSNRRPIVITFSDLQERGSSLQLSSKAELANQTLGKVKEIISVLARYSSNLEVVDCTF